MLEVQLTWGGKRAGAGRPRTTNTGRHCDTPHRERPELDARHPVHVSLRLLPRYVISLRNGKSYRALRSVLWRYYERDDFRIVHLSIQKNHVHLLVEAANRRALSRGMQSFAINAARAIHATIGSEGKVFAFRYHATHIKSTWYARNALAYVINNWRRHGRDQDCKGAMRASVDPYASGLSYPPWAARFKIPDGYVPLPVSAPRTWLLREGYKRHGEIDPWETPANAWAT